MRVPGPGGPIGYAEFLTGLEERIRAARVRAALAVNRELVVLYWQIGREILARQEEAGWGAKVIQQLADDLRREFPDMKGLSSRNLKYMRQLAGLWPDEAKVQQLVAQIPWGHNVRLLGRVKDPAEREWSSAALVLKESVDDGLQTCAVVDRDADAARTRNAMTKRSRRERVR